MDTAIGRRIGVAIRMIGATIHNHTQNQQKHVQKQSAMMMGLSVNPMMALEAKVGTCSLVSMNPKILDVEIRIMTMDSVLTQSPRAFHTPFQSRPL